MNAETSVSVPSKSELTKIIPIPIPEINLPSLSRNEFSHLILSVAPSHHQHINTLILNTFDRSMVVK